MLQVEVCVARLCFSNKTHAAMQASFAQYQQPQPSSLRCNDCPLLLSHSHFEPLASQRRPTVSFTASSLCASVAAMSGKESAQAAKALGNAAFSAGKYDEAVKHFTEAISHDPTDAIFYSNRSGAFASLNQPQQALDDATKCIELNPAFVKGYSRKGHALHSLGKYSDAKEAYEAGLKLDAGNAALKEGLEEVTRATSQPPQNPFASMFGPDMWGKLMADPVTKPHLSDPAFVQKMNELQRSPALFGQYAKDPKVGQAMGVLLGLPADMFGRAGAGGMGGMGGMGGEGGGVEMEDEDDEDAEEVLPGGSSRPAYQYQPPPRASEQKQEHKAPQPKAETELTEEEKKKREAEREKEAGNKLFTAKKFDEAIEHYQRAAELDPTNIVYLNNAAACHYEKKDYPACIATSMKALEVGREQMSSYKDVAKAWLRVGNAHAAEKKWSEAIEAYDKSLVEDMNDKAKVALKKAQEQKRKHEEAEYINPELSEQEKQKGNELYNQGKWIDAIGHYSEALKRNPKNYK